MPLSPPRTIGEDGHVPHDFNSSTLSNKPILRDEGPSARVRNCAPAGEPVYTPEEEARLVEHLRDLGYE